MHGKDRTRSSRTSRSGAARASLYSARRSEQRLAAHTVHTSTRSSHSRRPDALTLFVALLVIWPLCQFVGLAIADAAGQVRDAGGFPRSWALDAVLFLILLVMAIEYVLLNRYAVDMRRQIKLYDRACRLALPFIAQPVPGSSLDRSRTSTAQYAAHVALVEALGSENAPPPPDPSLTPEGDAA